MTRTPKKAIVILLTLALQLGGSFLLASDDIHHLKLVRSEKIVKMNAPVTFKVTAHRENGSLIKDAKINLTLMINSRHEQSKKRVLLKKGQTETTLTFSKAGAVSVEFLNWRDKDNNSDDLFVMDSFRVKYAKGDK